MKTLFVLGAALFGCLATSALCQEAPQSRRFRPDRPAELATPAVAVPMVLPPQNPLDPALPGFRSSLVGDPVARATREAWLKLKEAENDDAQEDAKEALRDALSKEYDARLDEYETHLDKLRKQLADLTEQLQRRRDAKSEMVRLRLQMMVHEADGLAWPDGSNQLGFPSPFRRSVPAASPGAPQPGPTTRPRAGGSIR